MNILIACGIALASQSELNVVPSTSANIDSATPPLKHQAPSRAGYINERGNPGMASRTEQGQPALQFVIKREQRQI